MLNIRSQVFSENIPVWLKTFNACILIPILLWPLIFQSTIFFFDDSKNLDEKYILFFVVNAYPIYATAIIYYNSVLFLRNNILGSVLPFSILISIVLGSFYFSRAEKNEEKLRRNTEEARKKQGYIGMTDDFKILNNYVYYYDSLIVGADAKTFQIIHPTWEQDKDYYYNYGKRLTLINKDEITILNENYAKDKNTVYCQGKIVDGAEPNSFKISSTEFALDANNCYMEEKKIDCNSIQYINKYYVVKPVHH